MTYVKMRETVAGTEYWNKALKRIELFSSDIAPENVQTEGMVGLYSASGKVAEVATIKSVTAEDLKEVAEQVSNAGEDTTTDPYAQLNEMNADELRAFAKQYGIDVPGNMKKPETIRQYIIEEFKEMDEAQ